MIAKIYANLILNKAVNPKTGELWTLEDVPVNLRDEVANILNPN